MIRYFKTIRGVGLFGSAVAVAFLASLGINAYHQAQAQYAAVAKRADIAVFLGEGEKVSETVGEALMNIDGVADSRFVSREMALEKAVVQEPEIKEVLIPGSNPFVPYFVVRPRRPGPASANAIRERVSAMEGVDEVRYDRNIMEVAGGLDDFVGFYRLAGKVLVYLALLLIVVKYLWMWLNRSGTPGAYFSVLLIGAAAGAAGAGLYYLFSMSVMPSAVVQMPPILLAWAGMAGLAAALGFAEIH